MSRSPKHAGALCLLFTLTAAIASPGLAGESKRRDGIARVRVPGLSGVYVQQAALGAARRLAGERCRTLLSEYTSEADGRPLTAGLEARGVTLEQHLRFISFEDGSEDQACRGGGAFAGMHRSGDDRVYVCSSRFRDLARSNPVNAEVIVIHEMLHTLGLGENPPTSLEITARVFRRCVDSRD